MLGGGLCIVFYTKYNNTILQIQVEWSTVEDTEGGTSLFAHCTHCKHWPRSSPVNTRIFRTSLNGFRRYELSLLLSHCFTPNLRVWSKTAAEVSYLVEKSNFWGVFTVFSVQLGFVFPTKGGWLPSRHQTSAIPKKSQNRIQKLRFISKNTLYIQRSSLVFANFKTRDWLFVGVRGWGTFTIHSRISSIIPISHILKHNAPVLVLPLVGFSSLYTLYIQKHSVPVWLNW